jgi:hypothetical protein
MILSREIDGWDCSVHNRNREKCRDLRDEISKPIFESKEKESRMSLSVLA